jgi:hypothetical protein
MEISKKNQEYLKYREEVVKIQEKMGWSKSDLYKKLEKHFGRLDDFDFPLKDTFLKQYNLKGGSLKHFQKYFEYLYNLPEVKEKLLEKPKGLYRFVLIVLVSTLLFVSLLADYDPNNKMDIISDKSFKECQEKCLKQNDKFREKSDNLLENFRTYRVINSFFKEEQN